MATTRELAEAHAYGNRRQQTSLLRGTDEALRDPGAASTARWAVGSRSASW